jgi:hypothetical protein
MAAKTAASTTVPGKNPATGEAPRRCPGPSLVRIARNVYLDVILHNVPQRRTTTHRRRVHGMSSIHWPRGSKNHLICGHLVGRSSRRRLAVLIL